MATKGTKFDHVTVMATREPIILGGNEGIVINFSGNEEILSTT
jgi:hypothetical protein